MDISRLAALRKRVSSRVGSFCRAPGPANSHSIRILPRVAVSISLVKKRWLNTPASDWRSGESSGRLFHNHCRKAPQGTGMASTAAWSGATCEAAERLVWMMASRCASGSFWKLASGGQISTEAAPVGFRRTR